MRTSLWARPEKGSRVGFLKKNGGGIMMKVSLGQYFYQQKIRSTLWHIDPYLVRGEIVQQLANVVAVLGVPMITCPGYAISP